MLKRTQQHSYMEDTMPGGGREQGGHPQWRTRGGRELTGILLAGENTPLGEGILPGELDANLTRDRGSCEWVMCSDDVTSSVNMEVEREVAQQVSIYLAF